jgi:hypothetical protein
LAVFFFATNGSTAEYDQDADAAQNSKQRGGGFRNYGGATTFAPAADFGGRPSAVPEPSTLLLAALGALGLTSRIADILFVGIANLDLARSLVSDP